MTNDKAKLTELKDKLDILEGQLTHAERIRDNAQALVITKCKAGEKILQDADNLIALLEKKIDNVSNKIAILLMQDKRKRG